MGNRSALLLSRSRLFHLKPINVGTYFAESLTSYIARLAEAHCMTAGELIGKEITPILEKPYLTNIAVNGGTRFYENASMLNGIGNAAREFVEVLEKLTLCSDLRYLTMIPLSNIIPDRNLCRNKKVWCPLCLQKWKDENQIIYEPLLWALQSVSVCIDHGTLLQAYCSNCKQTMPILERRSKAGYCSKCGFWLGKTVLDNQITISDNSLFIIAQQIAKIIAEFPAISIDMKSNIVSNFVQSCIKHTAGGNIAEYSRMLSKPKTTVWGWATGKNLPPIEPLMRIGHISAVSIVDMLLGKTFIFGHTIITDFSPTENFKNGRRNLDKEHLLQQFDNVLAGSGNVPLSLKEISRRLVVDSKVLKSYFPELCKMVIHKNREYQEKQTKERLLLAETKITKTVLHLSSIGIYPSRRAVENVMPYKGALRRKNTQSIWKALVSTT